MGLCLVGWRQQEARPGRWEVGRRWGCLAVAGSGCLLQGRWGGASIGVGRCSWLPAGEERMGARAGGR